MIFSRSNLDPNNEYQDEDIWEAIDTLQLRAAIEKLPASLDSDVVESKLKGVREGER
jgi:ABC-type multidrug transport system fused ATPase/permease subunit